MLFTSCIPSPFQSHQQHCTKHCDLTEFPCWRQVTLEGQDNPAFIVRVRKPSLQTLECGSPPESPDMPKQLQQPVPPAAVPYVLEIVSCLTD